MWTDVWAPPLVMSIYEMLCFRACNTNPEVPSEEASSPFLPFSEWQNIIKPSGLSLLLLCTGLLGRKNNFVITDIVQTQEATITGVNILRVFPRSHIHWHEMAWLIEMSSNCSSWAGEA